MDEHLVEIKAKLEGAELYTRLTGAEHQLAVMDKRSLDEAIAIIRSYTAFLNAMKARPSAFLYNKNRFLTWEPTVEQWMIETHVEMQYVHIYFANFDEAVKKLFE